MPVTAIAPIPKSPWITVKEAARYLGMSIDTVYEACASRGLRHAKAGAMIRLKYEWLDEWLETQTRTNAPPHRRRAM